MEDVWHQRRVERPERSIIFEVADTGSPIVVEDANNNELVSPYMARLLKIRSLVALPLETSEGSIGSVILGQRDRTRIFTPAEVERSREADEELRALALDRIGDAVSERGRDRLGPHVDVGHLRGA